MNKITLKRAEIELIHDLLYEKEREMQYRNEDVTAINDLRVEVLLKISGIAAFHLEEPEKTAICYLCPGHKEFKPLFPLKLVIEVHEQFYDVCEDCYSLYGPYTEISIYEQNQQLLDDTEEYIRTMRTANKKHKVIKDQ